MKKKIFNALQFLQYNYVQELKELMSKYINE